MKCTFIYTDDKSNKFWTIEVNGNEFTVTYGKVGADGQTSSKSFADEAACQKEANKLIAEKTKKGYVEQDGVADAATSSSPTSPVFKRQTAENPTQPVSIACEARIVAISPLTDGGFCAADEKGNFMFFGPGGELRSCQTLSEPVFNHIVQNNHVYIYDKGNVVTFDYSGAKVKETPGCSANFNVLPDGRIIFKNGESISQVDENGNIDTLKKFNFELSFRPSVAENGEVCVILKDSPRVFVLLDADGSEKWQTKLEGPNAWAPQKLTDGKVVVMSRTTINVIDTKNHRHTTIPVNGAPTGWACPVGDDCVAYATDSGTVEIVSFDKKRKSSVRRETIGETNSLPVAGNDKEMFAPSKDKNVYRIAADGTCTGVCTLERNIGSEKRHATVLTGGTFVICDSGFCINLLTPETFGKGQTPVEPKFLTKRAAELVKHFEPWAATPTCKTIIKDILGRLVEDRSEGDTLELDFLSTDGETITVSFGPPEPGKAPGDFPESYRKATELHGWVSYDNGNANGFYWSGNGEQMFDMSYDDYDFEPDKKGLYHSNEERYAEVSLAGQNCFIFDRERTNKLGEPLILLFDHGGDFDAEVFNGDLQKKTAYGIPGFIFRVIGYDVFPNDPRFDGCGMG